MAQLETFSIGSHFQDSLDWCKKCGELESACSCGKQGEVKGRGDYFLSLNEKKVKGRDITHCGTFFEKKEDMQILLKAIKRKLSCGGSIEQDRGFWLILQGRHRAALKVLLKAYGFQFKT